MNLPHSTAAQSFPHSSPLPTAGNLQFPLTFMFIVSVNEGTHAVVPQLDDSVVKAGQDPWSCRVEGQTYMYIYTYIHMYTSEQYNWCDATCIINV